MRFTPASMFSRRFRCVVLTGFSSVLDIHAPAAADVNCETYNRQSQRSADALARELIIANGTLLASDLAAGRNPKLDAYLAQFAADVRVHGLQGRPEPAGLADVKAHYALVMGSASSPTPDAEGGLKEDLAVVAGPMAAHRYHAVLHVPGFPPDFAYYDPALALGLRGQTVFDYGGPGGTIRERWSNHDNRFRTGQLWRYMLSHPEANTADRFRKDLLPGSDSPGGLIDRDGDRLNAVFNGELALRADDFTLLNGAFHYGKPERPEGAAAPVTEGEGLRFVQRWFSPHDWHRDIGNGPGWFADDATLHGAGCDAESARTSPAVIGGAGTRRLAALTLEQLLQQRLGPDARSTLLQATTADAAYEQSAISAWSFVAFQTRLEGEQPAAGSELQGAPEAVQYCAQWVMRLRAGTPPDQGPRATDVWLDLRESVDASCRMIPTSRIE